MRLETFSIRNRVLLLAITVLLLASLGPLLFLRDYAVRAADRAFDRLLAASALSIAGAVHTEDQNMTVELPYAALAMLSSQQRVFYSVRDAQGTLITGYDDLDRDMPLAHSATPVFENRSYRGDDIRIGTLGRLVSTNQQAGWVTIRVAETREARQALADEILHRGAASLPIMATVALLLLWFGITRAFMPLRGIEQELRQRSPETLEPLASPVPYEVKRLVEALNGFMQRLGTTLGALNNLVADAAHQVRTPLASLRAQTEVALEESDPQRLRTRLERIHLNAKHASILVNQLLMDATITHRLDTRNGDPVALTDIVHDMRQRIAMTDAQRLHIALANDLGAAHIDGDRIALREMLRNLVDNALRHAPEGPVDITAEGDSQGRIVLTVADRGPGIPDAEKEQVLERFARGATAHATPGSGLGLSIVKTVVEGHGGTLSLQDRPGGGLLVRVTLPLGTGRPKAAFGRPDTRLAGLALAACLLVAAAAATPPTAQAQVPDIEAIQTSRYPAPQTERATLTLAGPTDTPIFARLAHGFQRQYPDVTLIYHELGSRALYERTVAGTLPPSDILISSAVDLQLRLANDGMALRHESMDTHRLPSWAIWRSEVFSFTFEPIVMVYNTDRFTSETVPHSRLELLRLLERDENTLHDRIGTYDIVASSLGHLLATQDDMISSNFWGLANALGRSGVQLAANTQDILDGIEQGRLDLGYNVLGSYVRSYQRPGSKLAVQVPNDYQLFLSRAALILRDTPHPRLAGTFIDWLVSPEGQQVVEQDARLGALPDMDDSNQTGKTDVIARNTAPAGIVQPIALNPTLLVSLDKQRHNRFLQNWLRLVTDTPGRSGPD